MIPGFDLWVQDPSLLSCDVRCRHGLDPVLLWLWRRLAAAAPIWPLAWELPYATGAALKKEKTRKKNLEKVNLEELNLWIND